MIDTETKGEIVSMEMKGRIVSQAGISDLADHLGYWLRRVSNSVSGAFAEKLAGTGVSVAEWVIMRRLYGRSPVPPSRIALEVGMTRGGISKIANRLVEKGLAVRHDDNRDSRSHTLSLTVAGRRMVTKLAALADDNDAEFFGTLSAAERRELRRLVQKIVRDRRLEGDPLE